MNKDDIVVQGKHEELLECIGFYAEIYNSVFKYALMYGYRLFRDKEEGLIPELAVLDRVICIRFT